MSSRGYGTLVGLATHLEQALLSFCQLLVPQKWHLDQFLWLARFIHTCLVALAMYLDS